MCGIFCSVSAAASCPTPSPEQLNLLRARGPDSLDHASGHLRCFNGNGLADASKVAVTCWASVLSLRGDQVTKQPLCSPPADFEHQLPSQRPILCWNGEIWAFAGQPLLLGECDLSFLYQKLCQAVQQDYEENQLMVDGTSTQANHVLKVVDSITGPFAIVFLDQLNGKLYYGRDRTGRRSLLTKTKGSDELLIASVGDGSSGWIEIEAGRIHILHVLDNPSQSDSISNTSLPRLLLGSTELAHTIHQFETLPFNSSVPNGLAAPLSIDSPAIAQLENLLHLSLIPRLRTLPKAQTEGATRFAVLFSGGLDCTTLARMMHDILPSEEPIDLLNVAFENPRISSGLAPEQIYASCPDRMTALTSHTELTEVCPQRKWRLVLIDVPYTETLEHRPMVKKLMHPHSTEMDLSLATALYFAARGQGTVFASKDHLSTAPDDIYRTSARILISGLGADELFGGYQRHATAFARALKSSGIEAAYKALLAELELDYRRLGARNLGRDDRVLSHWGRECRFPFLDESIIAWAIAANVDQKCGFSESRLGPSATTAAVSSEAAATQQDDDIEPGKLVLRLVAAHLGMWRVARERKRAMQFGARSAKMESGRTRGTDVL